MKKYLVASIVLSFLFSFFLLSFVACGINNSSGQAIQGLTLIASYNNGRLFQTNTTPGDPHLYVLQLNGTFEEMGQQYGYLMRSQLAEVYDQTMDFLSQKGILPSSIEATADYFYQMQSQPIKQVIAGMAQTSGLSLEAVKIVSSMPIFMVYSCSMVSAWGDYTTDGTLYIGRNWDLNKNIFVPFAPYMMIVVYNPTDYAHSIADIGFCGSFFPQTCMNSKGLFIELNNGAMSSAVVNPDGVEAIFQFIPWLLSNANLSQLLASIESIVPDGPGIFNIADSQCTYSYEMAADKSNNRTATPEGLIAASNDFADPRWTNLPFIGTGEAYGFTLERRANLFQLVTLGKGSIDAVKMKEILDTTIPNGGATFPDNNQAFQTYYQVVAIPSLKQMWFKFRGYSGWEFIPLDKLFTNQ